jgi:hypothetical protein
MEIFSCYTTTEKSILICKNNGTRSVVVNISTTGQGTKNLAGTKELGCSLDFGEMSCFNSQESLNIANAKFMTITPNGSQPYTISLGNSSIQSGQFYFVLKMNTSSGSHVAESTRTSKSPQGEGKATFNNDISPPPVRNTGKNK